MKSIYLLILFTMMIQYVNSQCIGGVCYTPSMLTEEKRETEGKKKDEFISKIAVKFEYDDEKLQELKEVGFGRFELIKLLLISTYTATDFDEVIKLRKSGNKLSEIAKKYNLNYKEIYIEARKIKKELEEE